ncbi:extensin-like isoform X2 [Ananas comosus]|uniref:Extensin-like isoform X2 n=1 Tax=Ananas comosus TaxID=4615 RepID=A0A6P5GPI5_ANACO|nr:extensin-like isoform X2 [Ananas comosus]
MELGKKSYFAPFYLILHISIVVSLFTQCARSLRQPEKHFSLIRSPKKPTSMRKLEESYSPSDPYYYFGSPFVLPPYGGDMGPSSSPTINPPFCVYPPVFSPPPPSTATPTPSIPAQFSPPPPISYSPYPVITPNPPGVIPTPPTVTPSPPEYVPNPPGVTPTPPTVTPSPPEFVPNPPGVTPTPPTVTPSPPGFIPSPPEFVPSPPEFVPSPPSYAPGPPGFIPSPPEFVPGPPMFLPPIVYPPPLGPPPPPSETMPGLWCVAKPTVPDPIIQEAMDYACGSGADCDVIQPNGSCYQPDTLISHASFAFNSYWQRTKVAGGTCDFGGTAILVTRDPSYDGCHFNLL